MWSQGDNSGYKFYIKVYNAHKDASGKRVQRITIEYNFIGEIYIPDEEQKETA